MILDILLKLSPALEHGRELENADTWRSVDAANKALVAVFGFALIVSKQFGFDFGITEAETVQLAGVVAAIGGSVSTYLHHATSTKSGIKKGE